MTTDRGTRINKYLSEAGYCSRRAADRLIAEGRVQINGELPLIGTQVREEDVVSVDGQVVLPQRENFVYLALNKPVGIVCTTDTHREPANIIEFVNYPKRIFPIGRLDKASQGLILLTNDGDIVNQILRARNNHEKEYIVKVDRPLHPDFIHKMGAGVPILDTVTRPCEVEAVGTRTFRIVLTQGLNRQIRRMCEALGYRVRKLKRVRIMNIQLGPMPVGAWRPLTRSELRILRRSLASSSKTHEGTPP